MDARWGWPLAALALVAGYFQWGWQGLLFAGTVVVFWLLLQFSRSVRALGEAGKAPLGSVANAVMLHAKLRKGLTLLDVLRITGSLGDRVSEPPDERFVWTDGNGDSVEVLLKGGKVAEWQLRRAAGADA
ncbi:hypothetical protein LRH25_27590 [Ideonella azotifigens]|uniref:Glycerate kinase n=1 Tax=Ideonella azotifigens TaxID=513160 RepID=A0ABN1KB47_9BURK|nr:hypothetical protein [Ideonella azotifigens]MCD2344092.1 hypothetical protein [Ideonella azotifigens]